MSKADILRRELARRGMTHQELSEQINYSRSEVSKAAAGYPVSNDFWVEVAQELGRKDVLVDIESKLRAKIAILEQHKRQIEKAPGKRPSAKVIS